MQTITKILAATTALSIANIPAFADTKSYDLNGFDQISVSSGIDVEITIGPDFRIVADARNSDTFDKLDLSVRGHTLYIDRDSSVMDLLFGDRERLSLTITLPALDEISANAGSDVFVTGAFGDTLTADASSGADIELENVTSTDVNLSASSGSKIDASGTCTNLEVSVSSGADVKARALECKTVIASASSGAGADVFADEDLTSSASSGGDVNVYGAPENTDISNSSGGGTDLRD